MCVSVQQIYHISLPSLEKTQIVPFPHPPIDEYCYVFLFNRPSIVIISIRFVCFVRSVCVNVYQFAFCVPVICSRVCVCARVFECFGCDLRSIGGFDGSLFFLSDECMCVFFWQYMVVFTALTQWINRKYNNFSDNFNWLIIINCEFSVPILRWLSPPLNEFIISTTRSSVIDLPLTGD